MSSDFIASYVTRKTHFFYSLYFLWCMAQRSLYAVTKIYYRSISYFATVSRVDTRYQALLAVLRFPGVDIRYHDPSYTMWA
jgi:hypothetical protein